MLLTLITFLDISWQQSKPTPVELVWTRYCNSAETVVLWHVFADTVTITTKDRSWIGAWWLGYLLIGAWVLVAALPLFLFPKSMKKEEVCKECVDGGASDIAKPLTNGAIDVHWKNSSAGAVVKVDNVSKKANLTEKSSNCSLLLMSDKKQDQRETPRVGFCQGKSLGE